MPKQSRREKGTGNIYQRKNGTWVGRLNEGVKTDGKPKIKYFSGKTESEVKRKIRDYNSSDKKIDHQKITVEEYILHWLKVYKKDFLKPSSYDRLENTIIHQIIPYIGHIRFQKLSSDNIQILLSKLKNQQKLSYSTIKKTYDVLNSVYTHATIRGDVIGNPMLLVTMPSKAVFDKKEIRIFTKEEARLIVEEATRVYRTGNPIYQYGNVYILMLNTGIRIGEAIGLQLQDYDKTQNTLHIRRNIQYVKNRNNENRTTGYRMTSNTTKTYSGCRDIPLNKNAVEAIERLCSSKRNCDYIVTNSKGNVSHPDKIHRGFYHLLDNVGIQRTGTHSLRHTFASFLFANGVDIKTISKILGHASIQITLNTYIHLIENTDYKAVNTLDEIF